MSSETQPVVAVVRVPTPRVAPRWLVRRKMAATIDLYASLPGLAYKIFTIESGSGDFGGAYLWVDQRSADAWFDGAWRARVLERYGQPAAIERFEAPILLPTKGS